jgi:hypothetical protein
MFDDACRQTMLDRLGRLKPEASRRWGRMTAPQMIAHLSDQMRHALEDSPVAQRRGFLRWAPVRYLSIYVVPWPKGRIKGPSEAFLTQPTSWDADVTTLQELLRRFVALGPDRAWPPHALMGRMSGRDWGVFVHKHFDHHFRQFGV